MGEQLRWWEQSKIFRTIYCECDFSRRRLCSISSFPVLYRRFIATFALLSYQSIPHVHPARMEGMYNIFAPGDRGFPALSHLRGASVRHFYGCHVGNPGPGDLERRNWDRAVEKGASALGEEVEVEKHPSRLRQVFHLLVLALRQTCSQIQKRDRFVFSIIYWLFCTIFKVFTKLSLVIIYM